MHLSLLNANSLKIPLANSVAQTCITSPPYYALRDYGVKPNFWPVVRYSPLPGMPEIVIPAGYYCLGGEETIEQFIGHMVLIYREVKRVLREDGTNWINIGDSYNGSGGAGGDYGEGGLREGQPKYKGYRQAHLKNKDLMGVPWRLAFALQADGWYLRSDSIWVKPNAMPSGKYDRPGVGHEYMFLLSKQPRYYYDRNSVREEIHDEKGERLGKNQMTPWIIPLEGSRFKHYATFPQKLPEIAIKLSTSEFGACPYCGKGWERVPKRALASKPFRSRGYVNQPRMVSNHDHDGGEWHGETDVGTLGWKPGCDCTPIPGDPVVTELGVTAPKPVPSLVLDIFSGSATTGIVARKLGRSYVGLELSLEYLHEIAVERTLVKDVQEWEEGKPVQSDLTTEGLSSELQQTLF